MKRILILEGRETIGGGQIITKCICDVLSKKYDIAIFVPGSNNDISNLLSGYQLYHYNLKQYTRGRKTLKDYFNLIFNIYHTSVQLNEVLKKNTFDLLYIQHQNILPVAILLAKKRKIKIISHLHVFYIDRIVRLFVDYFLNSAVVVRIFGVSNYTLTQISLKNKKKSCVLYNPVFLRENIHIEDCNKRIAVVGDVIRSKGQHIVFESIKSLSDNYELYIIGNIIDRDYYNELLAYSVNCHFTGLISDVPDFLVKAKISLVVIPSISPFETFSLAMTESWSLGIPTIATNAWGMKELVYTFLHEYRESMLFSVGDSDELAKKISNLCSNNILYKKISIAIHQIVSEFLSKDQFERKMLHEIAQIIN